MATLAGGKTKLAALMRKKVFGIPVPIIAVAGAGVGYLILRKRRENAAGGGDNTSPSAASDGSGDAGISPADSSSGGYDASGGGGSAGGGDYIVPLSGAGPGDGTGEVYGGAGVSPIVTHEVVRKNIRNIRNVRIINPHNKRTVVRDHGKIVKRPRHPSPRAQHQRVMHRRAPAPPPHRPLIRRGF